MVRRRDDLYIAPDPVEPRPVFVIHRVGKIEMRMIEGYTSHIDIVNMLPPQYIKEEVRPIYPTDTLHYSRTRLTYHRIHGIDEWTKHKFGKVVDIAYWPENWADDWGLDELAQFLEFDLGRHDYGTADFVVPGTDVVAYNQNPGPTVQRTPPSSSGTQALPEGLYSGTAGLVVHEKHDETRPKG